VLAWQHFSIPAMPPRTTGRTGSVFRVLRRPDTPFGFAAVALLFAGQFALFTYLRPFLETVTRVSVSGLSLILLGLGFAGLIGTWLIGRLLPSRLALLLVAAPLALAVIATGLITLGAAPLPTAILLAGWGLVGTAAPVAWWTWISKALPDEAEAGGGLMVAVIQLAITLGASLGGLLVDARGYHTAFGVSAAILVGGAILAALGARATSRTGAPE
jgi:predicted MFS family arabinose efflux permease